MKATKQIFTPKLLTLAISSALLTACGGGGSSTPAATTTTTSGSTASSYQLPEQLEIVASGESTNNSAQLNHSLNTARSMSIARAFSDSGTEYDNAEQNIHTWMEALQPVELVNTILCFTDQMNADEKIGDDAYTVLIDMDECEAGEADSSTQSGGQSSASGSAKNYVEAVVKAEQDTATGNVIVHAWVPEMDVGGGDATLLKMKGVIKSGATDTDPFGSFVLNWEMKDPANPDGAAVGYGELATVETLDGFIGFTLYDYGEHEEQGQQASYLSRGSVVMRNDQTDGVALTAVEHTGGFGGGNMAFAVSFNTNNVLLQQASTLNDLPFRNGGSNSSGTCLAKDDFKEAVWRYGVFDQATGAEVQLNGGFPIRYDSNNDGNEDSFGYAGYFGIWTEQEGALSSGDTVVRETHGDGGTAASYTVVKTEGRLIKKEIETLPLADAAGIDFYYWDELLGQNNNYQQWVVRYQDGSFKKVAGMQWGEQGPQQTPLDTPVAIVLQDGHPLFMHSDQLGGGVQYKNGANSLTFYKETFMNGSEDEFTSGTLNLVCADRCVKAGLTANDLNSFDGGFEATANDFDTYSYSISNTGSNAMTLTSGSTPVSFPDGVSEQSPNGWGIQSGPMVTQAVADTLSDPYQVYDSSLVSTFYVWETGPNDWNKSTMLKDSLNNVVSFDKPIEFTYTHSEANHRDGSATSFAEVGTQTFMLHYNGPGNLHGIPHKQVGNEQQGRWYPLFNLNDGSLIGPNNEYVVKALDIERKMNQDTDGCGALVVNEPAAPVPSSVTVYLDELGDVPEVDAAPVFVGGEVPSDD